VRTAWWKAALVLYGIANALLYSALLPLWEGFDEPFHYGYAEHIVADRTFPELGKSNLSREIWNSLHLAPGSEVVKQNLPWIITYSEYFRMPESERMRLRSEIEHIARDLHPSDSPNYEAQQAPLAYLILAAEDEGLSHSGLLKRVLILRSVNAAFAVLLTAAALFALASILEVPGPFQFALVFMTFSSQMFYASVAHICNDWLAIPLMIALVAYCASVRSKPTPRNQVLTAATLVVGLLSKAYFLAMIPLVAVVFASLAARHPRERTRILLISLTAVACCLPWYGRNFLLYGNLTGMQQFVYGANWRQVVLDIPRVPWAHSLKALAFQSIWTGNNSFTSFSAVTVQLFLSGLGVAAGIYIAGKIREKNRIPGPARTVIAACALYTLALAWFTALTYSATGGSAISASPWYVQPFISVVEALLLRGLARFGRTGVVVTLSMIWLSAYMAVATYWVKLIPLYAGYPGERTTLRGLIAWYGAGPAQINANLETVAVGGPLQIGFFLVLTTALAVALAAALTKALSRRDQWWTGFISAGEGGNATLSGP
jgi:hypothetical protein